MVDDIPREPIRFRLLVRISSLLAAGTGLSLFSDGAFKLAIDQFRVARIPMAPSTALLFVL